MEGFYEGFTSLAGQHGSRGEKGPSSVQCGRSLPSIGIGIGIMRGGIGYNPTFLPSIGIGIRLRLRLGREFGYGLWHGLGLRFSGRCW